MLVGAVIGAVVGVLVMLWALARRRDEAFLVERREGKLRVVRGDPPGDLLGDFDEILSRQGSGPASIRAVRDDTHTRLEIRGVDPGAEQQLRNVFSLYPMSKLRRKG